jgi:hypothetical protein
MMKFLAVVMFCVPAFGQAAYSGHAAYSKATFGAADAGIPRTYTARTDNCVSGSETGCSLGTTTGEAGSVISFLLRNSDTVPFADITSGNANMNSTGTDADFGSYLVMATDEGTAASCLGSGSPWTAAWNMGAAGEYDAFSNDSSLMMVHNQGGNTCILFLNPAAIHAKTCATASPACVSLTSGTVATAGIGSVSPLNTYHLVVNGNWNFSRIPGETNVLYEMQNPPTKVNRVVICANGASSPNCSAWVGPGPLLRTVYHDFTSETGSGALPLRYVPGGWSTGSIVAPDGAIAFTLGGGQDWLASWTPVVNETFLFPQTGNAGDYNYQAIAVTGPTGGSNPSFCQTPPPTGCTTTDGGVTWNNIGPNGGQGPAYDVIGYSPSQGSWRLNTRIAKIYRGVGNTAPAGSVTTNDDIACTRAANGGAITYPCLLPDEYTLHAGGQSPNGRYVLLTPTGGEASNAPGNWNSGTLSGQISNSIWSNGVGGGNGVWSSTISYARLDIVVYGNPAFFYKANTSVSSGQAAPPSNANWDRSEAYPLNYVFDITTTNISPCTDYLHCGGHAADGYNMKLFGGHFRSSLYARPVIQGVLNPDAVLFPAGTPCDFHGSWRQGGTTDTAPVGIINTCVPAWPTGYTSAGYGEIDAVQPDGSSLVYRFAHAYNTGSSPIFAIQNNIGVISYLGDLIAFGTDMMGKRGDQNSSNAVCANPIRGMYQPGASQPVAYNDTMLVLSTNFIYKAVGCPNNGGTTTCTEAVNPPDFTGVCPNAGQYCTSDHTVTGTPLDNNVVWLNLGQNSCRSDVVIVDLLSAHPAP